MFTITKSLTTTSYDFDTMQQAIRDNYTLIRNLIKQIKKLEVIARSLKEEERHTIDEILLDLSKQVINLSTQTRTIFEIYSTTFNKYNSYLKLKN